MNELRKNLLGILSTRASVAFVAKRIITDEDLVALYWGGNGGTCTASYKYGALEVDAMTFPHGTLPPSDVADIYPVAIKSPLNTFQIYVVYVVTTFGVLRASIYVWCSENHWLHCSVLIKTVCTSSILFWAQNIYHFDEAHIFNAHN